MPMISLELKFEVQKLKDKKVMLVQRLGIKLLNKGSFRN